MKPMMDSPNCCKGVVQWELPKKLSFYLGNVAAYLSCLYQHIKGRQLHQSLMHRGTCSHADPARPEHFWNHVTPLSCSWCENFSEAQKTRCFDSSLHLIARQATKSRPGCMVCFFNMNFLNQFGRLETLWTVKDKFYFWDWRSSIKKKQCVIPSWLEWNL